MRPSRYCNSDSEVSVKRFLVSLLAVLLLAGCTVGSDVPASSEHTETPVITSEATETPEHTPASGALGPFIFYSFHDQPDWRELSSACMFEADLDRDGVAEPISFTIRPDGHCAVAITWGDSTIILDRTDELMEAFVLDLDTQSPFYNLLVVVDHGSDSYGTFELHPENGQLVRGASFSGSCRWSENALWSYEITDFLGTAGGKRTRSGDSLTPDSEWLTMCYIPTTEELETDLEDLVAYGDVIHTVLPVPCTIDGQPNMIPADSYLYRLRIRDDEELIEVKLLDGTVAKIACTLDKDDSWWPYLIDGIEQDEYFDNLLYAD